VKPQLCDTHGVVVHSGACPDCVAEGVAVLTPAADRAPWRREIDRAALLYRLQLVRIKNRKKART
jgi:hypothetical protein